MNTNQLAIALRNRAAAMIDDGNPDDPQRREVIDTAELVLVLARVLQGKSAAEAFGAPGDWGYGTPIGDALAAKEEPKEWSPAESAIKSVLAERARQDSKWGEQNHDPFTYLTVLVEEVGEYAEAALHHRFGGPKADGLYTEATHVAAVGLAILECLERQKWSWPRLQTEPPPSLAVLKHEICAGLVFAEEQCASEKLAGNVAKEEYWKGELQALHRMRQAMKPCFAQGNEEKQ